jgi:hypothetical protein
MIPSYPCVRLCSKVQGSGTLTDFLLTVAVVKVWHAVAGIYLYVCPTAPGALTLTTYPIMTIPHLSLAGSSLPLSITSGVSSESAAPSVGQYGFVPIH